MREREGCCLDSTRHPRNNCAPSDAGSPGWRSPGQLFMAVLRCARSGCRSRAVRAGLDSRPDFFQPLTDGAPVHAGGQLAAFARSQHALEQVDVVLIAIGLEVEI